MDDEDRNRAAMIDGLISDLVIVGGPDVRHLQQRIVALETELASIIERVKLLTGVSYSSARDAMERLEEDRDCARIVGRNAETELAEERARLDWVFANAEILPDILESPEGAQVPDVLKDRAAIDAARRASGDYRANAEAEAAAPGTAAKPSGGD